MAKKKELSERNKELHEGLTIRDKFDCKKHDRKKEFEQVKFKNTVRVLDKRDKMAGNRHHERLMLLHEKSD